jgi:hypothetical protein
MNLLLVLPKLFIYELFQIFLNLLDHDESFESSIGLFEHKCCDKVELVGDPREVAALEFEENDPIGNNLIEGGLLTNFIVKSFVVPQSVAKHLEEGEHLQLLDLLVVHQLIEDREEDGGIDYLGIVYHDFIQHLEKVVLHLHVLLLRNAEEV